MSVETVANLALAIDIRDKIVSHLDMVLWGGLDSPGEVWVDTSTIRVEIARIAVGQDNTEDVHDDTHNPSRYPSSSA